MSGDISKSYNRNSGAPEDRIWPVMTFVAATGISVCAGFAFYQYYTGPVSHIWGRGYTHVSFDNTAPALCEKPYTLTRAFTARNRKGEPVSGVYCGSDIFGYTINMNTDIADAAPSPP